jgi:hypothetical protein
MNSPQQRGRGRTPSAARLRRIVLTPDRHAWPSA